jgi:hypothetical protein
LAAKKGSGATLGNARNIAAAGSVGRTVQINAADELAAGLLPIVNAIRATGATTLEAITPALNDRGVRSAREATCTSHRFQICLRFATPRGNVLISLGGLYS